jgi:glycosyltransferase involved in cell wall biosynthesis
MRILHCVESYYPSVGGMQEVVKQLSERLAAKGHEVTVATRFQEERKFDTLNGVKVVGFKVSGNAVSGIKGEKEKYIEFLLNGNYDVVTFFAAQQWATDLALPILDQIKGKKVSVPTGYSGYYWETYQGYFNDMKKYIHGYDMNVYLSYDYRDINFAKENKVDEKKITLIPNGAGADEFLKKYDIDIRSKLNIPNDDLIILSIGSYTGWKGHNEMVEMFLRSNIKNATLLMIGNHYQYFKKQYYRKPFLGMLYLLNKLFWKKRIIFDFFPRDFTVACYLQSDIFLFPSNIECSPIVLFECAAAKLPFLASDAGNSGEIAKWTGGGLILPTEKNKEGFSKVNIKGSIKMLEDLVADKNKRQQMGETAFENWKKKYSWEVITDSYENLYKPLIQK